MGTTPEFGFRFPELNDPANGPLAFENLALDVEARILQSAPLVGYKSANTAVSNSTTLVNATGLSVTVGANRVYLLDGFIINDTDNVAKIKFGWSVPSGCEVRWQMVAPWEGNNAQIEFLAVYSPGDPDHPYSQFGIAAGFQLAGTVITGANGGTVQLRFAQNTARPINTTVNAGSWIRLQEVPS